MSVGHKVFGGVGTRARYCDIVILREIFFEQNSSDVASTFLSLGHLSYDCSRRFPTTRRRRYESIAGGCCEAPLSKVRWTSRWLALRSLSRTSQQYAAGDARK
jgi:hypothetical protein